MSSLATDAGENQSAVPCNDDDIRSDWVGPIGLRQLEFYARTLYLPQSLINYIDHGSSSTLLFVFCLNLHYIYDVHIKRNCVTVLLLK